MYMNPQDDFDRLSIALDAGELAWWEIELPSGVVFFSDKKAHMIGREPKEFVHYKNFTELLHPDDYEKAMQAMKDHMEGRVAIYQTKYRIQCKDGSYRLFLDRGKIVQKTDKGMKIAGIVVDVTDLRLDEI